MLDNPNGAPKVHPASREILPDDPLEMQAYEMPGDQELMVRMLVEEYARLGWGVEELMRLSRDPNYFAFNSLYHQFGEEVLRRRFEQIIARCGVMRVKIAETAPLTEQLVQIDLPT
jgi:hypothetical protein